ncbi:patatin family protein [uncultured Clostridium sp.]|jgi:predicted patatin/cPLA2 family phospholipase|uniref:patatin-like phospholipase family protein n=1 Tax=uncultured Clostridium sp. TaxID=59620 RepID=UPI0026031DFD|nr:patatin family protein [uncultured Clostridium sp.]
MPSLVLEGGSFRGAFSAGVMDALLDNEIMFPYCIGVSAGISNCFSYVSKQKERNIRVLEKYRNDKRYIGVKNFIKHRSLFGLDFIFDEIPNKLDLYDYDTFRAYEGKIIVGVSNILTGRAEYLDGKEIDKPCTMARATCAIPILFPIISIGENKYYDGGLCDPIPVQKAIDDGNEKHLIILTSPDGYRLGAERINKVASRLLKKKYPKIVDSFLTRHIKYNETLDLCERLELEGKAVIIRPSKEECINGFEKDIKKIKKIYNHGYNVGIENVEKIKKLFD